jgi:hypothetical protein
MSYAIASVHLPIHIACVSLISSTWLEEVKFLVHANNLCKIDCTAVFVSIQCLFSKREMVPLQIGLQI